MAEPSPAPRSPADAWHPEPELISLRDEAASREALRRIGELAWDAGLDYLYDHAFARGMGEIGDYAGLRSAYFGPTGRPGRAPSQPTPLAAVIGEFSTRLAPYTISAFHPRSYAYFTPPPLVASIVGELLAQITQQGVDLWHAGPVAAFVEEEVVRWLCDLVGYGPRAFGILTSGGTMANFIGMALARDVHLARLLMMSTGDPRPPRGARLENVRVYTSDQTHFSVGRALDELGFPPETLVLVPADDRFRLRGEPVAAAIARDREAGLLPFAIAAVAGATNTGSVDVIGELADVAAREDLWLHVDAAYGAAARLSPRDRHRVADLDRADSVTVDPHKWLFQGYDIGGLMVRDGSHLGAAFGARSAPEYYRGGEGPASRRPPSAEAAIEAAEDAHDDPTQLNFWKLGFEGSRRWRALKLWMSWKHLGTDGLARLVEANLDVAAHLAERIRASEDFEALPREPELSVVCFRHLPPRSRALGALDAGTLDAGTLEAGALDGAALDAHQDFLQAALEADGDGWLSTTRLRGATWLRAGIVNTQTTPEDADRLLARLRFLAET